MYLVLGWSVSSPSTSHKTSVSLVSASSGGSWVPSTLSAKFCCSSGDVARTINSWWLRTSTASKYSYNITCTKIVGYKVQINTLHSSSLSQNDSNVCEVVFEFEMTGPKGLRTHYENAGFLPSDHIHTYRVYQLSSWTSQVQQGL